MSVGFILLSFSYSSNTFQLKHCDFTRQLWEMFYMTRAEQDLTHLYYSSTPEELQIISTQPNSS